MVRLKSRSTALPAFVPPQLATLTAAPPEGADWVHEIKYDGYRAIAALAGDRCRIYTRSGQDWTDEVRLHCRRARPARRWQRACSTARSSPSTATAARASSSCKPG